MTGRDLQFSDDARPEDEREDDHHGRHHRGGRGKRLFDYGDLRLLILAMIVERPAHGYELIKAIEERLGGSYSPSPGVIYPTLAWLDDMGYASITLEDGGRKLYHSTAEGRLFVDANRKQIDEILARALFAGERGGPPRDAPDEVVRGMHNIKMALRMKLRTGAVSQETISAVAAALDEAARKIEQS